MVANKQTLTQIVLAEPATIPDGEFGVLQKTRWRRIFLGIPSDAQPNPDGSPPELRALWELWEASVESPTTPDQFFVSDSGTYRNVQGMVMPFLPVAVATVGKPEGDPLVASIPLLGVAWANLGHWQQASNLRFYRELVAFPQPTLVGELQQELGVTTEGVLGSVPGRLRVGPMVVVRLVNDGEVASEYKYTAPPVEAFEPLVAGVSEKLETMAALGMSWLGTSARPRPLRQSGWTPQQRTLHSLRLRRVSKTA